MQHSSRGFTVVNPTPAVISAAAALLAGMLNVATVALVLSIVAFAFSTVALVTVRPYARHADREARREAARAERQRAEIEAALHDA